MEETITLDAEFANSIGKSHHLRLKNFDPSKTAQEIKSALTKLTKLDLFEKDGIGLFKEVLHATVIVEKVEILFDNPEDKKAPINEPVIKESVALTEEIPPQTQMSAPPIQNLENIQDPQDLTIVEARPESGVLIKTIELPQGVDPWQLDEDQASMLVLACMVPHASLLNVEVDDQSVPAKLIITQAVEEEKVTSESQAAAQSPPEKPIRKRKRLIDRIRKRE
ncbi:hypothetical protein IGI39_003939 [Enterococcus sp. AZ135]|uniref:DUF2922 family protein n=1 Tax=unclassified Enterococcus TaxID=2608891 RepID=UPI003F23D09E